MIPDPSSTSATPRSSEHNDNSHDKGNASGVVNNSEDESGNENRQKNVKKRKRGSENVQHNKSKASRSSGSGAGSSRGKQTAAEAVTLFEVVTMGRSAMQAVIDDWIEAYVVDRDLSLLDLISFFIQCSGCKGIVTAEMCQSKKSSDVKNKMVEELDEVAGLQYKKFLAFPWILTVTWPMDTDSVEYPLVQSGPYGRWFHSEFCDFLSVLVAQCQHDVIFDSYLMNTVISLLAELSNSNIRAFRHTCTLAAVKLLSSLVGVALSLRVGIENSQKLYEVEKTKTTRQKGLAQLEKLQKKITDLQEKRAEIESMMDVIFKGVFLRRYRDVLPEIRSVCMEELGQWMKLYNSAFLNDTYLKYMGWLMHDKVPDVRLKCVLGLQGLYEDPLLLPKLDLFTSRFKVRMMSMTLDKDSEVAVQSMKLLMLISKACDDVFSAEDYKQLYQLVFSSQRPLAATAGELLFSRLLNTSPPPSDAEDGTNEEDAHKRQTLTRLKALLRFYLQSELHQHVVYLVDSLWDCGGSLLKDWTTLTSVLLQDATSDGSVLTREEELVVVEILVASVRQASEGPALAGRTGAKKVLSVKEKKLQVDDCMKLTEHFLAVLPELLSKFSSSADVVASLMKIPQYFITECRQAENTQAISSLVAAMGAVLDLHSSPAVLQAAARTYLSLCGGGAAWCSMVLSARDSLVQDWVDRLTALLRDSLKDDTLFADEEKMAEIVATLKKLCAFYNGHDLSHWGLSELLFPLLSLEGAQGGAPPQADAVEQRRRLSLFCERSQQCLVHSSLAVRQQAFVGICDVLTAHSFQLHVAAPPSCGPLLYTPNPKLQRALLTFVSTHVFSNPDSESQSRGGESAEAQRLDELHRRRNLLAAYCKLIVHGVLEMSMAAEVFMHFTKYSNDFGDIIKETLSRSRQTDKIESARMLDLCLQQLFMRLKREQDRGGTAQPGIQTFTSIKELARRFALTFGDLVKFRESVIVIHRSGIEFVFQGFSQTPDMPTPAHLVYLTILSEFSSKLLRPDKKTVLSYLEKHTAEHVVNLRDERWQPLLYYRASLLAVAESEDGASYVSTDRKPNPPHRSPSCRQRFEVSGNKSPSPFSPADGRGSKGHRSGSSSSWQKAAELDSDSVPVEKMAAEDSGRGSNVDTEDDVNVEV
ncbi:cohesin subunit SA-2 isoform X2 [Thalassophryne amazonica]|uniref:cohesin subunit SA-2 isoform X2 n=1 Tax=Thalassophryne amazonica TaxID=390379 RepID=UPI001470A630|nr:cohesin subunit SA-2 isoform X2 [Thalassophryne amazonica]